MPSNGILDQYGRTTSSASSLFKTPSQYPGQQRQPAKPRAKTYEAVPAWQRREMVDVSRVIAAGVPTVDAALLTAGEFAIGDAWHIKYRGTNKTWGDKLDTWFNGTWQKHCNARGEMNDWNSSLRQFNWTRKVEGDYAVWFDGVEWTDAQGKKHLPTGQFNTIKYDRISTGLIGGWRGVGVVEVGKGLDEVAELPSVWNYYALISSVGAWSGLYVINDPASPFDGQKIIDGVILDANMGVLGYRLVGFDKKGQPTYMDIPKSLLHFNFSARKQMDLVRGFPEIAESIMPMMDLDDINYLIRMAIKLASGLAITRESSDGNPARSSRQIYDEEGQDSAGNPVTWKRAVEEIYPGLYELAVNNKESLKSLSFDRPTMNEEAFVERIETAILHKLWPRSLIYGEDTKRGGARALVQQARSICRFDQRCVEKTARWIADRSIAYAMKAGFIPTNNNLLDPYNYVFSLPAEFTIDQGQDLKMFLEARSRGLISSGKIIEADGYMREEIRAEILQEADDNMADARALHEKYPEFPIEWIAMRLDSGGANMAFNTQDKQDAPETEPGQPNADGAPGEGDATPPKPKPAKK